MPQRYTVQQGDYLSKIAVNFGFRNWRTIYDHPLNADFRQKRPNPNILRPGDQIVIPDRELHKEDGATDKRHVFVVNGPVNLLRIVLKGPDHKPLANVAYTLKIEDRSYTGHTDAGGMLERRLPADASEALLTLDKVGVVWSLKIGHLDPLHDEDSNEDVITGIQARLNNLGYPCGTEDGIAGPKTRAALARFQASVLGRTGPDGLPDAQTRNALLEYHGS